MKFPNHPSSGSFSEEEALSGPIITENAILPVQFFQRSNQDPIRRLMDAILTDALDCLQTESIGRVRELYRMGVVGTYRTKLAVEAYAWLLERDERNIFSFDNVCETLGIEPKSFRKALLIWREAGKRAKFRRSAIGHNKNPVAPRPPRIRNRGGKANELHTGADRANLQAGEHREVRPMPRDEDLDAAFESVPDVLPEVRSSEQPG